MLTVILVLLWWILVYMRFFYFETGLQIHTWEMSNFFVKLIKNPFVINLLLVIVVSCGVVYGVLAWLDSYTRHNQAVVVPDVKGMKLEGRRRVFPGIISYAIT